MAEKPRLSLAICGLVAFLNVSALSTIAAEPLPAGRAGDGNGAAVSTTERNLLAREHSRTGLAGIEVARINDRLAKGRVVAVSPALTEADVSLPERLSATGARLERLPTGLPVVTVAVEDDATIARGVAGPVFGEVMAVVFRQLDDGGFVFANKDDAGNFVANQMFLANGFAPGDAIIAYDLLVYNAPTGGPASVKVSLWDGDPLGIVDTQCNGAPAPIPGTTVTFTDLPPADDLCPAIGEFAEPRCVGLFRLKATLPGAVAVECNHVWMVLEISEGCRLGWRKHPDMGHGPDVGFSDYVEALLDRSSADGFCCDNGQACNHSDADTTNDCPTDPTFCTDGVAEYPTAFSYGFLGGG